MRHVSSKNNSINNSDALSRPNRIHYNIYWSSNRRENSQFSSEKYLSLFRNREKIGGDDLIQPEIQFFLTIVRISNETPCDMCSNPSRIVIGHFGEWSVARGSLGRTRLDGKRFDPSVPYLWETFIFFRAVNWARVAS